MNAEWIGTARDITTRKQAEEGAMDDPKGA